MQLKSLEEFSAIFGNFQEFLEIKIYEMFSRIKDVETFRNLQKFSGFLR
jgi:hypothetical protein